MKEIMQPVLRPRWVLVGFWLVLFLFQPPSGKSAEGLVVYSGRGEKFTRPVLAAFRAKTGIRTESLVSSSGNLLARIREEGRRTPADVFMANYAGMLEKARKGGLLQSYASPMLGNIPPEYIGPGNMWFGASLRARAILYNKELVDPALITSTLDLARPEWKDKLAITVSTNGSFIGGLATMIGQHGLDAVRKFLIGIKGNAGENIFPKHTPIVSAVARGELALGLINHYYFYRAIGKSPGAPLGIIYPDQESSGAPTTISGLAIVKHAKHLQAARAFVDFVLSREGQKIYAEVNFEFPVSKTVPAHPKLPNRRRIRLAPVNQALKVEKIDQAVELIKTVGMH